MGRRGLSLWGLVLLGCGPEVVAVPPLSFPTGSQALILATEDGEDLDLVAYPLSAGQTLALEPVERYVGRYPIRLSAFFYAARLETLGLSEGTVPIVDQGQALSLGFGAQRAEVRGLTVQDWSPLVVLDPPLSGVRIPAPDPEVCLGAGGCYIEENGEVGPCQVPCPTPTTLLPPAPPAPPVLGPCTQGWREVPTPDGPVACEPWPELGRQSCPSGQAHFPGTPGCGPVGVPCEGDYLNPLPAGPVRYVDPNAAAGGDGTLATPFRTIAAALAGAPSGVVLALRQGNYREDVSLSAGVTLAGACAANTILSPTGVGLRTSGADARALNLTIRGGTAGVEARGVGRSLFVKGLIVEGVSGDAATVDGGAHLEVEDAAFQDTGGSYFGRGVGALRRVILERSVGTGIFGSTGELTLQQVAVLDGVADPNGGSRGLLLQGGVTVVADHLLVEGNRGLGVLAIGAVLHADDVVVRGTRFEPQNRGFGDGLQVGSGSTVVARRLWVRDNQRYNLMITGEGASFELAHGLITDAIASDDDGAGSGLYLQATASASVSRALIARTDGAAVLLNGLATDLALFDTTIRETGVSPSDGGSIDGLRLEQGARILAARVVVQQISGQGVEVRDIGSTADLQDLVVEDTGRGECHPCSGVCASKSGAIEQLLRARIRASRGRGVWANGAATVLRAYDLEVEGSAASAPCVNSNPASSPRFGDGVAAVDGGEVELRRFYSHHNEAGGLTVEQYLPDVATSFWARDGVVEGNGTGAFLIEGYDARRLAIGVIYRDNTVAVGP
ncbi:MAG: hypothetical protein IPG45_03495 [Deltaproteobacteria bacterium]|nr:hypothetical protein [Deltaproteobacteria bacterium]